MLCAKAGAQHACVKLCAALKKSWWVLATQCHSVVLVKGVTVTPLGVSARLCQFDPTRVLQWGAELHPMGARMGRYETPLGCYFQPEVCRC